MSIINENFKQFQKKKAQNFHVCWVCCVYVVTMFI